MTNPDAANSIENRAGDLQQSSTAKVLHALSQSDGAPATAQLRERSLKGGKTHARLPFQVVPGITPKSQDETGSHVISCSCGWLIYFL